MAGPIVQVFLLQAGGNLPLSLPQHQSMSFQESLGLPLLPSKLQTHIAQLT